MNFCKNCKFYKKEYAYNFFTSGIGIIYNACTRMNELDVVTGKFTGTPLNCYAERENALRLENERCGYEGKYWEIG